MYVHMPRRGSLVAARLLALGQLDLLARQLLVGDLLEQVRDEVQPRALLVVGAHDVPRARTAVSVAANISSRARE